MATWHDVQRAFRESFLLDRDDETEFTLTLPVPAEGEPRKQRVMVRVYDALDTRMLELRSAFAQVGEVDALEELKENLSLPLGAIARHGRFLVLVQRIVLPHTTVEGVIFAVTAVSHVADWLEARHGGDRF